MTPKVRCQLIAIAVLTMLPFAAIQGFSIPLPFRHHDLLSRQYRVAVEKRVYLSQESEIALSNYEIHYP